MRLGEFILENIESILSEWDVFARRIWPATLENKNVTPAALRDHAEDILRATASDMTSEQSIDQQEDKSKGDGPDDGNIDTQINKASEVHGTGRGSDGFELWAVVAEYRALRASVLRLWRESGPAPDLHDLDDVTRFNESIDQSLTESVRSYTEYVTKDREHLLGKEQEARAEAETANRAKDMFLATLSHEMRTPLNAIVGWVGILRRGNHGDDVLYGLDVIERSTKAQVQLIEDVLDVSRIVSGKMRLEMCECDIRDAIYAGVEVTRAAAHAKGITIDVQLAPEANLAYCDLTRVQQIVWNLVSNAIKFTPKGGLVAVKLSRQRSSLNLVVSDNGHGIDPDLLPYIFDRFRQADSSTRRKFGGLGLGLSIVKHLVESHGGTIEVSSDGQNLGATFSVLLPTRAIKAPPQQAISNVTSRQPTEDDLIGPQPLMLHGLKVLVVDDNKDARQMLLTALESVGAIVTLAASADEAMKLMQTDSNTPDLLVSDLGMPDQDGFDLIRHIRRQPLGPKKLPAVALSGFAHSDDARDAIEAGFQAHRSKPVDFQELTVLIRSLVSSHVASP